MRSANLPSASTTRIHAIGVDPSEKLRAVLAFEVPESQSEPGRIRFIFRGLAVESASRALARSGSRKSSLRVGNRRARGRPERGGRAGAACRPIRACARAPAGGDRRTALRVSSSSTGPSTRRSSASTRARRRGRSSCWPKRAGRSWRSWRDGARGARDHAGGGQERGRGQRPRRQAPGGADGRPAGRTALRIGRGRRGGRARRRPRRHAAREFRARRGAFEVSASVRRGLASDRRLDRFFFAVLLCPLLEAQQSRRRAVRRRSAGLVAREALAEAIRWRSKDPLRELPLPDIIQLVAVSGKTGVFTLTNGDEAGKIFLRKGQIVHASAGTLSGEQAVYELARWLQGDFVFTPAPRPKSTRSRSRTPTSSWRRRGRSTSGRSCRRRSSRRAWCRSSRRTRARDLGLLHALGVGGGHQGRRAAVDRRDRGRSRAGRLRRLQVHLRPADHRGPGAERRPAPAADRSAAASRSDRAGRRRRADPPAGAVAAGRQRVERRARGVAAALSAPSSRPDAARTR